MAANMPNFDVPAPTPSRWSWLYRLVPGRRIRCRTEADPGLTAPPRKPESAPSWEGPRDLESPERAGDGHEKQLPFMKSVHECNSITPKPPSVTPCTESTYARSNLWTLRVNTRACSPRRTFSTDSYCDSPRNPAFSDSCSMDVRGALAASGSRDGTFGLPFGNRAVHSAASAGLPQFVYRSIRF